MSTRVSPSRLLSSFASSLSSLSVWPHMGVSVADLLLGGIIPGILMAVTFIVINIVYAIRNKLPRSQEKFNLKKT